MPEVEISVNTVKDDFDNFLKKERNSRIFFSGRFGTGKTYFLKNFFDFKKEEYEVFHLYPVNYQINSNENILDLIKYDILIELIKKDPEILQGNVVKGIKENAMLFYSWARTSFSANNILQSVIDTGGAVAELSCDPIFSSIGKLGRPLVESLKLDKDYQEYKKKYLKGEKAIADKFLDEVENKGIRETDYFSDLLKRKIDTIKGAKKSVLVLDDLDRIDPEHIFRILNILSAYFEKENGNKFGFDSIIIVADYSNLQHIFHHKFGPEADFNGYVDKYHSICPYYFDNNKAVLSAVDEIVKAIKNEERLLKDAFGDTGYIKLFLCYIFNQAINCGIINLRELLKGCRFCLFDFKKGGFNEDRAIDQYQSIIDIAIKIVIQAFSNTDNFLQKLKIIKESNSKIPSRMPFERYNTSIMNYLGIIDWNSPSVSQRWNDYELQKEGNLVIETKNKNEDLFYDLLSEYITTKKYLKGSLSNYEN